MLKATSAFGETINWESEQMSDRIDFKKLDLTYYVTSDIEEDQVITMWPVMTSDDDRIGKSTTFTSDN